MSTPVLGLAVGIALGFALAFGGGAEFIVVAVFAAAGLFIGKVLTGEVDVDDVVDRVSNRSGRRSP